MFDALADLIVYQLPGLGADDHVAAGTFFLQQKLIDAALALIAAVLVGFGHRKLSV